MKQIFILIFILIMSISCSNANKTGTNYNNGNSSNGNNSGNTGETITPEQKKKNQEWINKVKGQKITKMSYYFDNEGNIINNGNANKEYTFHKCLDANTSVYYYEGTPEDLYDIGDPNSPSGLNVKIYCAVKIVEEQNKIYFLDGISPKNCKKEYEMKISDFIVNNHDDPNWSKLPIMTENDIDVTIDIKDKRWNDWGNFGANIIG